MCTAFMAGVLTGYALSKCTQETPPLKTFAIDYICLSAWRNFRNTSVISKTDRTDGRDIQSLLRVTHLLVS